MLGKDFYRIDSVIELSQEKLSSLVFFYQPLIGNDALILYEYMALKTSTISFEPISGLLSVLNYSIDTFENACRKLNEYRLLKTYQKQDHYIFKILESYPIPKFIKDDILVREFILKTSGTYYQELISNIHEEEKYPDYQDVSFSLSADHLKSWTKEDESYLHRDRKEEYAFNTLFDVGVFLKDISLTLLPMRFRTRENLQQIATLADLYNISYDRMRTFLPRVANVTTNEFDVRKLRYLCMKADSEYHSSEKGQYNIPCVLFLMNLQDGKEATEYDKKIILNLSQKYHLNIQVINVLLEHTLKNCDNRLIEKYINALASDMHRNDITTAEKALQRLNGYQKNKAEDKLPEYDTSRNSSMSYEEEEELLKLMGKK